MLNLSAFRPPSEASKRVSQRAANRNRVSYQVAQAMAAQLLEQRPPEGTRLPPEMELCAEMGCSQTSLRSALRLLESWGLITIQTGRDGGPVVRYPRPGDLTDILSVLLHTEGATLRDVLAARRVIDPIIAGEAAVHATKEHLAQLDRALDRMRNAQRQRESLDAAAEFQSVMAAASGQIILGLLLRLLTTFGEQSQLARVPFDKAWQTKLVESFEHIRDAIVDGRQDEARERMVAHRVRSERHWNETSEALLSVPLAPFEFSG